MDGFFLQAKLRMRVSAILLFVSVLALSPLSAFGAGNHACDYLNKNEVVKVMGSEVVEVEAQPANPMGQSICFFDIPADMAVRFAQLQMFRSSWAKLSGADFTAPAMFENNMSFLDNLQEISGIGEKAYWGGSGIKLGAGLHVLYEDSYFTIMVATGDLENNLKKSIELASVVIGKI